MPLDKSKRSMTRPRSRYEPSVSQREFQRRVASGLKSEDLKSSGAPPYPDMVLDPSAALGKYIEPPWEYGVRKLQNIVDSVTYKPGWVLRLRRGLGVNTSGYWIQWSWIAPNAVQSRKSWEGPLATTTHVTGTPRYMDPNWAEMDLIREIYLSIVECETHEINEFFRYKDHIIFDPHRTIDTLMATSVQRMK